MRGCTPLLPVLLPWVCFSKCQPILEQGSTRPDLWPGPAPQDCHSLCVVLSFTRCCLALAMPYQAYPLARQYERAQIRGLEMQLTCAVMSLHA